MFKFLILAVMLRSALCENSTEPTTTEINLAQTNLSSSSDGLGAASAASSGTISISNKVVHADTFPKHIGSNSVFQIRPDYIAVAGIGAYKLHRPKVTWNEARRTCANEGGHLLIIRSQNEEDVILRLSEGKEWWIGFHNRFGGEWITVLDEFLYQLGWSRWSTNWSPNPVDGSTGCGTYVGAGGGITHYYCDAKKPFICKM